MNAAVERFKVRSFDTNAIGTLTAPRLLEYLIEAAGTSADSLGFGIRELQTRGLTWVIGRIRVDLDQEIIAGDEIEIETWPSGLDRAVAMRDFRIHRRGRCVGRSTSRWFVLDMESRLAVRPHNIFPEHLQPRQDHQLKLSRVIPPLPGPASLTHRFNVRRADIDFNRHVTAASYIGWAMESVPVAQLDEHWLSSCDVQYLEECHLGDTIVSEAHVAADSSVQIRSSRASNDQDLARFNTTWEKRSGASTAAES